MVKLEIRNVAALMRLGCILAALAVPTVGLNNGVGKTPAMGYNTWDDFRCGGINARNVEKVADAIVRYGLDKLGYQVYQVIVHR